MKKEVGRKKDKVEFCKYVPRPECFENIYEDYSSLVDEKLVIKTCIKCSILKF